MPLFQEEIRARADGTGFKWQGLSLSPTLQQAGPAGVAPSRLLPAADGGCLPTCEPITSWFVLANVESKCNGPHAGPPPMSQHPHGEGGIPLKGITGQRYYRQRYYSDKGNPTNT